MNPYFLKSMKNIYLLSQKEKRTVIDLQHNQKYATFAASS